MVFSSFYFIHYFLPAVLAAYYISPRRFRHLILLTASYLFYSWANPLFLVLLLFSTLVDYVCARVIGKHDPGERPRLRRSLLCVSILTNLGVLATFKYANFLTANVFAVLSGFGVTTEPTFVTEFVLPLGLSFYTLQSMSYTIDVFRGHASPQRNFIDFACYVAMFPQLVAGPIVRYPEIAEQFAGRTHTFEKFGRAILFFSFGLAKKVLLANPCGMMADHAFDASAITAVDAWVGVVAYAMQIYFDFSGYSDMAIGLGLMFGFTLPVNFRSPYRASSLQDFWRRWHITLSSWLRDYLYVPLGGDRRGSRRCYFNIMIVMLIGGLWHGAAWTFLIWGSLHGLALLCERAWRQRSGAKAGSPILGRVWTMGIVLLAWVFFRADTLPDAVAFLQSMVTPAFDSPHALVTSSLIRRPYLIVTLAVAVLCVVCCPETFKWAERTGPWRLMIALVLFWLSVSMLATQSYNPFIYFIF